jgi:hypothetical protein
VEQGILTITVDETVMAVTQGSSAVARTDAPHAYANDGDEEVWFTMTVSERHSRVIAPFCRPQSDSIIPARRYSVAAQGWLPLRHS